MPKTNVDVASSHSIPVFSLSVGEPLSVDSIRESLPHLTSIEVLSRLKHALREHNDSFGTELFKLQIEYKNDTVQIIPGPIIGRVNCIDFQLEFIPKIRELELGKCLALAHDCNSLDLIKHENEVIDDVCSDELLTDSIDYFAKPFLRSIVDVIDGGLITTRERLSKQDSEIRGQLDVPKTISQASHSPWVNKSVSSIDLHSNRILKTALGLVKNNSKVDEIRQLANNLESYFQDVEELDNPSEEFSLEYEGALVRTDYVRALTFSKILFDGMQSVSGSEDSFSPFFTINLDMLFERVVVHVLTRQIKNPVFEIQAQTIHQHDSKPKIGDKFYVPDILLNSADPAHETVVIDTKNKYSLIEKGRASFTNQDLFQLSYYCRSLDSNAAVLVYPGNSKTGTKYPIKGSEGEASYAKKRTTAIDKILGDPVSHIQLRPTEEGLHLFFWRVDLSGSMKNTEHSFAQLALFLIHLARGEIRLDG